MHIPHSRPGIAGSPDLPIGPTRWGLYISGTFGALAVLFVSALVFSHITSPTGINWTKVAERTNETYQWIAVSFDKKAAVVNRATRTAQQKLTDPLADFPPTNGTSIATTSRISTTAASPKKGAIKTPSSAEIFITPEELENQIRALEAAATPPAQRLVARRKAPKKNPRIASITPSEFDKLVVIPAANIDPDMEMQIFKRASSYLKQRDISSASMILQYAAGLGSGISAMALAETFDPNYLKKVNLDEFSGSRKDARKWYYMAARLGINEADTRLAALK